MRRMLSIWWPNLAIERWSKTSDCAPDQPIVLTVDGTHGPIIHAVTAAAVDCGARAGARLTDARALEPGLVAFPADVAGDAALAERLARWAGRWSPLVETDGHGLRLDVTGVAHLFGGEDGLVADMQRCFTAIGLTSRIAIAPTATAAAALARYGGEDIEALPVAALRLDPDIILTLNRLGLKTVGALLAMPRLALARRFQNGAVIDALDRLTGRAAKPFVPVDNATPPRNVLRLEEPATYPEAAAQALERLIPGLVEELERRRLGARQISLIGYRVDGSVAVAGVSTSIPSREPAHVHRLLAEKAAALDPEFGFDGFALEAGWTEQLESAQANLVEQVSTESEVARLVDRLTVKLGWERVRRPEPSESHVPERASGWRSAISSPAFAGEVARNARRRGPSTSFAGPPPREISGRKQRPQHLLDRPEAIDVIYATPEGMPRRFVWRRKVHDIARVEGPERIAPEWWRQPSSARLRDYYRVEDSQGCRYWIYREGLVGDGRGGLPGWYLHGLFG